MTRREEKLVRLVELLCEMLEHRTELADPFSRRQAAALAREAAMLARGRLPAPTNLN